MSNIDKALDVVAQAQQTTGRWHTPAHKHGLLPLNKLNNEGGRYSLRVDAFKDRARIYAIGNPSITCIPLIETSLNPDEINKAIAGLVLKVEEKLAIKG